MSNAWTANTIKITKSERDVGNGNKAIDIGFTSVILQDGVLHHQYNEPNLGLNPSLTIEEHVSRIIQNHLAAWTVAGAASNGQVVPDVALPEPKPDPTPDEIAKSDAQQAFRQAVQKFNATVAGIAQGILKPDDPDLPASKQIISDLLLVYPEFKAMLVSIK